MRCRFHIKTAALSKTNLGIRKVFHNALDKSDRKIFDDMFSTSHLYNSVCSYAANPIRIRPIFMSIILYHYKQLRKATAHEYI
jgi:hypothetical protein